MNIGIIGTGNMGRSLGIVWQRLGHEVLFGARDPQKAAFAASLAAGSCSGTNDEAAAFGDLLLYTPRGVPPRSVLSDVAALHGKIVLDCNNQEVPSDFRFPAVTFSIAEDLARQLPDARIVKAFNTMSQEVFELCPNAVRPYQVAAFIASDDTAARATVLGLASEMGFRAIDCGFLQQSRLLETAADLIRFLIISQGMGDANFAIVDTPDAPTQALGGRQSSALK